MNKTGVLFPHQRKEVTEILEHKPGELFVRQIIRPKYTLKNHLQKQQEQSKV